MSHDETTHPEERPRQIALLGPQRHLPTLPGVVARLGLQGARIATITAGWQEREDEDADLQRALEGCGVNLRLHARSEAVYRDDPELFAAHRAKQDRLRHQQTLYRMRLGPLVEAASHLQALREPASGGARSSAAARRTVPVGAELLEPEIQHAVAAVRALDEHHQVRVDTLQAAYEAALEPSERPAVRAQRAELAALLDGCAAVALAGGHVATLLNRIRLLGLGELLAGKTLIGWSAGAMVLTRRIVLFHDHVPGGESVQAEVLASGLGLAPGAVVLPDAAHRLALEVRERTELLALRFLPEHGLTLDDGDAIVHTAQGWRPLLGQPQRLRRDGSRLALAADDRADAREDACRSPSLA